jgi:hypothetical protein
MTRDARPIPRIMPRIAAGLVLVGGVFAGSLAGLLLGKLVRDSKAMRGA